MIEKFDPILAEAIARIPSIQEVAAAIKPEYYTFVTADEGNTEAKPDTLAVFLQAYKDIPMDPLSEWIHAIIHDENDKAEKIWQEAIEKKSHHYFWQIAWCNNKGQTPPGVKEKLVCKLLEKNPNAHVRAKIPEEQECPNMLHAWLSGDVVAYSPIAVSALINGIDPWEQDEEGKNFFEKLKVRPIYEGDFADPFFQRPEFGADLSRHPFRHVENGQKTVEAIETIGRFLYPSPGTTPEQLAARVAELEEYRKIMACRTLITVPDAKLGKLREAKGPDILHP